MSEQDKEFIRGFACAIAALAREHDRPSMARDIATCNGFSLSDFKQAGVELFDLKPITEAFK